MVVRMWSAPRGRSLFSSIRPPVYFAPTAALLLLFASWQPGNYQRTVKRTEDAFQACNDIVACFQERARVERQYAQQLSEWSNKWKPVVDSSKSSSIC